MKAFSAGGRTHPKQHDMCLLILQTLIPADLFMQSVFLAVVPIALAGLGSRQKAALIWQHFLDLRAILTETSAMAVRSLTHHSHRRPCQATTDLHILLEEVANKSQPFRGFKADPGPRYE